MNPIDSPPELNQPGVTAKRTRPALAALLPVAIPPGHVGPVVLPGSGRTIWWTGRVAIGLRHMPDRRYDEITQSALWVQGLMLGGGRHPRGALAA